MITTTSTSMATATTTTTAKAIAARKKSIDKLQRNYPALWVSNHIPYRCILMNLYETNFSVKE